MPTPDPESWLDEHGSALYSFALIHVHDPDQAEDLVQETLLAALKSRERFQGGSSVRTWLIAILKHKILDEYRRLGRQNSCPESQEIHWQAEENRWAAECFNQRGGWSRKPVDWGELEQQYTREQFWSLVERCLAALSPRMSRLLVLRELWGLETVEVCKELAITPTNLWTTLHRARMSMRLCLEKSL